MSPGKGIEFPSSDGFPIHLDYTAIWGILPEQAPNVVRQFGTLKDVEHKVILPQIESICRLHGSRRGAVDLLVGDTREQFQNETSAELERVLTSKNLSLLFGLTRHIYVPKLVREPIQKAKIADELTKTRDQEQLTAQAQAELTESKAKVVFGEKRTQAETEKKVAEVGATGEESQGDRGDDREAQGRDRRQDRDHRRPDDPGSRRGQGPVGQAGQGGQGRAIATSGQGDGRSGPYERYIFAEGLPADLKVGIFYAGPGTLWTDLKGFEQTMLGKLVSETQAKGVAGARENEMMVGRRRPNRCPAHSSEMP